MNNLIEILDDLRVLIHDLNSLIVQYDANTEWEIRPFKSLHQGQSPASITGYEKHLYLCLWSSPASVRSFNVNGNELINQEHLTLTNPFGIDMDQKKFSFICSRL